MLLEHQVRKPHTDQPLFFDSEDFGGTVVCVLYETGFGGNYENRVGTTVEKPAVANLGVPQFLLGSAQPAGHMIEGIRKLDDLIS